MVPAARVGGAAAAGRWAEMGPGTAEPPVEGPRRLRSPERAPSGSGSGRRPSHGGWISRGPGRGGGGIPPARSAPAPAPAQGCRARSPEREGDQAPRPRTELRKAEVAVAGRPPGSPRSARLSELQHWRGPPGGVNKRPLPGDHRVSVCRRPRNRHPVSRPRTTDLGTRTEAQRQAVGETITQSQRRSHTPSRRSHPECHTQPPRDTRLGDSPSGFPGSSVQVAPLVCPSPCQGGALCLASEPLTRVPSPLSAQPRYLQ